MALILVSWVLVNWLLVASWLNPDKPYFALWACVVLIIMWGAWYNRNPPWPGPSRRNMIYLLFLLTVFAYDFLIQNWQLTFVILVIVVLWVAERLMRRHRSV
jgi:hypothetical protein